MVSEENQPRCFVRHRIVWRNLDLYLWTRNKSTIDYLDDSKWPETNKNCSPNECFKKLLQRILINMITLRPFLLDDCKTVHDLWYITICWPKKVSEQGKKNSKISDHFTLRQCQFTQYFADYGIFEAWKKSNSWLIVCIYRTK